MQRRFLDPLYGPLSIDERCRELAFSPEFQRLRYVRLCNINSLYLTGASEPKRFEHCIGVYHLAALWAESRILNPRDAYIIKAAALLHDLQTGPFGHSFQYVMEDNPFDVSFEHSNLTAGVRDQFLQLTKASAAFAGRPFTASSLLGESAEEVFAAIRGEGPFGPLISGTLDLDNLDNVVRLAFHMGLCSDKDRALPEQLTPLLEPFDGGLGARSPAHGYLERWFDIRKALYEYLLLDRGEFSAKCMLTLAVELAADAGLLGPDDWRLTDEDLLNELEHRSIGDHQSIGQIIKRLRVGDLFECVEVWESDDTALYEEISDSKRKREIEGDIEDRLAAISSTKYRICLHYILDKKKTCRALSYYDLDDKEAKSVGYNSNVLLIGAFITNARASVLSGGERARVSAAVTQTLAGAGLNVRGSAPDPLAAPAAAPGLFAE